MFIIGLIFLGIGVLAVGSLLLSLVLFYLSSLFRQPIQNTKQTSWLRLLACALLGVALFFGVPLLLLLSGIPIP